MISSTSDIYSVGIATVDITPPVGTPLAGFGDRSIHSSTAVYHPLRAVAVVVDDGETPMLLLSAEWIAFSGMSERVRGRLAEVTGLPTSSIILSATHTHCGPVMKPRDVVTHGRVDNAYLDHAVERMAHAAEMAWKHRIAARLRSGVGHCSLAMYRRVPDPANPGRVLRAMRPNPDGPTDHEVGIVTIESLDGIVRGILFNYACHPTSRNGLMIGGDYVGFAYDYLQEAFPYAQPCFVQGCGGDQKPRPADSKGNTFGLRKVEQVREIGFELGQAVEQAIANDSLDTVTGAIAVKQAMVELETEPLDRSLVKSELTNDARPTKQRWARYHQERIEQGLPEERAVPFEVQTLRFGKSLAMATFAGEMSVEHGLRLKRDLRPYFKHVIPMAYTNELVGYVASKDQFAEYGYEVLDANQNRKRTGRFVEETEDRIHDVCARQLLGKTLPVASAMEAATS
ncbi:hypothetical protein ACERK3_14550 [Phycisphaerales bacterium AB-hyl4]|uniref:Neutral/alkaline non-lysosomal ceramidase N-terminal domain-containing protein n=1 Tax=Natronomicrosphaera hydrolytica TaxID=3242702 RepID=A0ABV4U7C3_9BACT